MAPDGPGTDPEPWTARDVTNLLWTGLLGLAAMLVAYLGASSTVRANTQLIWIGVAVALLAVSGLGNGVWLAAGARSVRVRRVAATEWAARLAEVSSDLPAVESGPTTELSASVAVAGTSRYHDRSCQMVVGKVVITAANAEHEAVGRRPCPICLPDQLKP